MRLPSFKKNKHKIGQLGIGLHTDGVSCAQIERCIDGKSKLILCDFLEANGKQELNGAIKEIIKEHAVSGIPCACVLSPGYYSMMQIETPEVEPEELIEAVRWRIKDLLNYDAEEAIIDLFDIPEQHQRGERHMQYVVATHVPLLKPHIDVLHDCGVDLKAIDIVELALRNFASLMPGNDEGISIIHLGKKSGIIQIVKDSVLYLTRKLDINVNTFISAGDYSIEGKTVKISPQLQDALDILILELQRSLDYYESHFVQAPIDSVVLTPTEEVMPYLSPYTGKQLSVNACQIDLNTMFDCHHDISPYLQARCFSAVGGALRTGLDK